MLFICSDPAAPEYVAAEDNIVEWAAEMEARGVALRRYLAKRLAETSPESLSAPDPSPTRSPVPAAKEQN